MSIENHPNINAAGLVTDIVVAFRKYLRGNAGQNANAALDLVSADMTDFVIKISERLDDRFGV